MRAPKPSSEASLSHGDNGKAASNDIRSSSSSTGTSNRNKPRSRNGCWTCRSKKVKCDEGRPWCNRCKRLLLVCDYSPRSGRASAKFVDGGYSVAIRDRKQASKASHLPDAAASKSDAYPSASLPLGIPGPRESACSIALTSIDHEAIRYFRTSLSGLVCTKNPKYSSYGIIFHMAESNEMLMRLVLAIAGQNMRFRRQKMSSPPPLCSSSSTSPTSSKSSTSSISSSYGDLPYEYPLVHYSAAIRLMAENIDKHQTPVGDKSGFDLDIILAALFLMMWYERSRADNGFGAANHLAGVTTIVKHYISDRVGLSIERTRQTLPTANVHATALTKHANKAVSSASATKSGEPQQQHLSLFSARMLAEICVNDAHAYTFGVGGDLVSVINEITRSCYPDESMKDGIPALLLYSKGLYRTFWGDEYPISEVSDDVERSSCVALGIATVQLRYQVAHLDRVAPDQRPAQLEAVREAIGQVYERHIDVITIAPAISDTSSETRRFALNIRIMAAQFFACQLVFCRAEGRFSQNDDDENSENGDNSEADFFIEKIMSIARQSFRHLGHEGVLRILWPLYVVALEGSSLDDLEWILARFRGCSYFGQEYENAYRFLLRTCGGKRDSAGGVSGVDDGTVVAKSGTAWSPPRKEEGQEDEFFILF